MIARSEEMSRPASTGSKPIQTVGTPPVRVTRSVSIRSASAGGDRLAPGSTSVAPAITDACGSPQALAWNIGTTGRIVSRSDTDMAAADSTAIACSQQERWE